jgi:pimeloyl-ACP methyl ester carboxylesterase
MTAPASFGESSEVSWPLGTTTVYGTVVRPLGAGPFPGVVLVAGSGPTDRDWNSPLLPGTNGSGRLLAEMLGRAGIASLRYDKRASGPHVRETIPQLIGKITMQSHVDELAGAVRTLAAEGWVRDGRIFALGNSEGTLHVLKYQLENPDLPLAGLILTGPPGRAVGVVTRSQLAAQAAGIPNGEALLALYDTSIARFLAGEPIDPDPALPEGVRLLLQALETPANLPFARELWIADAATLLAQTTVPVLVVIGKKDLQVDWQADGEPLQRAATGRADITFLFPDNANHVLKHESRPRQHLAQTEAMTRYNAPDAYLDPDVATAITTWLTAHA